MSNFLSPIPGGVAITDKAGVITTFFRLRWQELIDRFRFTPSVANTTVTGQAAAIGTTTLYTAVTAGLYRVSWYLRKTLADGVSSSLQVTIGFLDLGQAESVTGAALTTDTNAAFQSGNVQLIRCDANSDITGEVAYASNTPGAMQFDAAFTVEFVPS